MIPLALVLVGAGAIVATLVLHSLGWHGAVGGTYWAVAYLSLFLALFIVGALRERRRRR